MCALSVSSRRPAVRRLFAALLVGVLLQAGVGRAIETGQDVVVEETPTEAIEQADTTSGLDLVSDLTPVVVLPFLVHSEHPLQYLSESLPTLLAAQLESTRKLIVVDKQRVEKARPGLKVAEVTDGELRKLAADVGATAIVAGSVTELAGRYSLDVRITPAESGTRSHTLVYTAESEQELINLLGELTEQVLAVVSGADPGRIIGLTVLGAGPLEPAIRELIQSQAGTPYDVAKVRFDRDQIQALDRVARVNVDTARKAGGVVLTFTVVRAEMIIGQATGSQAGEVVGSISVRGNRRIETDAILGRIQTKVGDRLNRARLASDVREINSLGFFRNVYVFAESRDGALRLTFEVEENPVIRQISILGNDSVDSDDIRDVLTLTTGSTLDYPLLHENTERITQLYRQQGYYLAEVTFAIGEEQEGAISIDFEVQENGKLKLKKVDFYGNEALSAGELKADFQTKTWRFYSWATSWFDHTGTYSEPIFARDLREVEKKYTDSGYLQVEIGEPEVDATEEGLFVRVKITEGPRFSVGDIDVFGDETVDLDVLRELLQLGEGDVFNRSHLTEDVEALERHYTDRGFFLASVQPTTRMDQDERTVDVNFVVEKGPLYFVRNINISGNTRTIDPVVRREMRIVEGQLYSARGIQISTRRIRGLGFFEDIAFEPQPTEDPSQLDLNVNVVERPTGSFSFGAGYSSQDKLVFTASLAQSNWLGRGYFVNLTVDIGGSTNRYFISLSDPYFLGSTFSFGRDDLRHQGLVRHLRAEPEGLQLHPRSRVVREQRHARLSQLSLVEPRGEPADEHVRRFAHPAGAPAGHREQQHPRRLRHARYA